MTTPEGPAATRCEAHVSDPDPRYRGWRYCMKENCTEHAVAATPEDELEAMTANRDLWRKALCEVLQLVPSHFEEIENVRLGQSPGGDPEKDQHPKGEWVVWDSEYPEDGSVSLNVMASPPHIAQIKADEELGARLVEVEQRLVMTQNMAQADHENKMRITKESTEALRRAESRASAAEGALRAVQRKLCEARCLRHDVLATSHIAECEEARELLRAARDLIGNLALSGLPAFASVTAAPALEVRAFARLVEILLDEAQDTIMVRARQTGQARLYDMAREAAKLCAVARDMQIVNAVGPRLGTDGVGTAVGRAAAAVSDSSAPTPAALVPKEAATPKAIAGTTSPEAPSDG